MKYVAVIVSFLIIVILVQMSLLYFALSSQNGLIAENGYEKGLAYQKVIDELERGEQSGLDPKITLDSRELRIQFSTNAKALIPVPNSLALSAKFPADINNDFSANLPLCSELTYCMQLEKPLNGLWMFDYSISDAELNYRWKSREVF